jgi:1-acyl-sn-glycerol-3-phosphate acyltransferase
LPVAEYILNDEGETLLKRCIACLEMGESVIIFPEGTRTGRNQGYTFKRGAAYLMLMSNCTVRPVHISCEPSALIKIDPWYAVPERKVIYRFTILDELEMSSVRQADHVKLPLKSRRLTEWLVDWYQTMDIHGPQNPSKNIGLSVVSK